MTFEAELHAAQGLGSAKSGLRHWLVQRITAALLIPLGVWFVLFFILLLTAPFDVAYGWLSSPWTASLSILFIISSFYHGYLGMQVIWEDYVSRETLKWALILGTKLLSIVAALLAIVSILKIFIS